MKKLILAISLLISIGASSQTYFKCSYVSKGTWTGSDWEMGEFKRVNLIFTLTKGKITVNDNAHSVYKIHSKGEEALSKSCRSTSWYALDEAERRVMIESIVYHAGMHIILVRYSDVMFVYTLNKSK
jgi:hypothetical protein